MSVDVAVIVPAHDEAETVARTLRSVLAAGDAAGASARVVVAADRCRDATAAIARRTLGARGMVIEGEFGTAGRARSVATAWALANVGPRWLASTDADTVVSLDWIAHQLDHFDEGYDGVAGVVEVEHFAEFSANVERAFHAYYAGQGVGAHPHVHGANMGFSAAAYRETEGWPDIAVGEDVRLWAALRRESARLLACRGLSVTTSGRRDGRARGGFASFLRQLEAASA